MVKYKKTFWEDCPNCGAELIVTTECNPKNDLNGKMWFCDGDDVKCADDCGSLAADIRNRLSPVKNLCAMLKNREVDPYMEINDKINDLIDSEIEKTLNVVEWLETQLVKLFAIPDVSKSTCIRGFEAKSHYCFECEKENDCDIT